MDIDWQQAVALGLAALAVSHIGWRAWRRFSSKTACAGCAGCGTGRAGQVVQERTVVPIESLTRSTPPIRNNDLALSR